MWDAGKVTGRHVFKLTGFFKVLVSLGRLSRKAATLHPHCVEGESREGMGEAQNGKERRKGNDSGLMTKKT